MVRYPQYPSYKQTPCSWLQEVPEHWSFKRLKNVATHNDEALDERTDSDFEIEYVDISSVNLTRGIESSETLKFEKAPSRARRKVKHGDIIVSTVRTYLKAIAPISNPPDNLIVSTGFAVVRPMDKLHSGYAGYLLQSNGFVGEVVANSVGVSYPAINASDLVRIAAVEPPFEEQEAIARFLDFKTAQIDALIAKKKTLLERLAEKRTALISHAVTKGLDPQVEMKDSGVDWLGCVPKHWKQTPFKWCCRITEGQVDPRADEFSSLPLVAPNHIESGTGRLIQIESAEDQGAISGKYFYKKGAILYSKIRPALVKACITESDGLCSADMYPIYPEHGLISEFLLYQILSKGFTQFALLVSERVAMPKVNREALGAFMIAIPPEPEQEKIVEFIRASVERVDRQQTRSLDAIVKLQEYRSALITNAVTGKIDVRNFFPSSSVASAST